MDIAERVHIIVNKYIKYWSYSDYNETYLTAHRAGIHIAQYKDAIDCGLQSYINDKIKDLKSINFDKFIKPIKGFENVDNDKAVIHTWINNLK